MCDFIETECPNCGKSIDAFLYNLWLAEALNLHSEQKCPHCHVTLEVSVEQTICFEVSLRETDEELFIRLGQIEADDC